MDGGRLTIVPVRAFSFSLPFACWELVTVMRCGMRFQPNFCAVPQACSKASGLRDVCLFSEPSGKVSLGGTLILALASGSFSFPLGDSSRILLSREVPCEQTIRAYLSCIYLASPFPPPPSDAF